MQRTPEIVERAVVQLYGYGYSMNKIVTFFAELDYSISVTTVYNILKRRNVQSRPNVETKNLDIDEIKKLYYVKHMPLADIGAKYNVCTNTVRRYLDLDGTYTPNYTRQDFDLRHDYFSHIDTEAKAYLLGYLLADGNVYYPSSGSPKLRMQLHVRDLNVLKFMRDELNSCNTIQYNTRNGVWDNTCTFCVTSEQLVSDLAQWGMIPAKTYNLHLPILSEPFMQHMIRGLFDGDGSVMNTDHCKGVDFSGMPHHLEQLQDYFFEHLQVSKKKIYKQYAETVDGEFYIEGAHIYYGVEYRNIEQYSNIYIRTPLYS